MLPWHPCLTRPQRTNHKCPCPHQICPPPIHWKKFPIQPDLISTVPPAFYQVLNLTNVTPLTAKIIQTGQSHPLVGTKGHLILMPLQSLPLTAHVYSLCSQEEHSCDPVCYAVSSSLELWVFMTSKLLSISSVQCWVLCVGPSPKEWTGGN